MGTRTLLVGDAAGFVTGTAAEGIYWSMVSAKLAVQVATQALRTGPIDQILPTYERVWQKQLKHYIRGLSDEKNADHTEGVFDVISRNSFFRNYFSKVFLGLQPPPGWLIELAKLRRRRLLKRKGGDTRAEVVHEVETPT